MSNFPISTSFKICLEEEEVDAANDDDDDDEEEEGRSEGEVY